MDTITSPFKSLTFTGGLQEILNSMLEADKEAHVQGVEAARDYNEHISDFKQRLYDAIIEERKNTEVYEVEIKEELSRTIKVRAGSPEEAMENIRKQYRSSEIVLDAEDFKEVTINAISKEMQTNIDIDKSEKSTDDELKTRQHIFGKVR